MLNDITVVKVALSGASYSYDAGYSYYVPADMVCEIKAGARVLVPFGRANRKRIGLVIRVYEKDHYDPALKPVLSLIDKEPLVDDELLNLVFWLKSNTFCTYFEAYRTVVPTGFGVDFNETYTISSQYEKGLLTPKEASFLDILEKSGSSRERDKLLDTESNPLTKEIIDSLVKKGALVSHSEFRRKVGDETVRMIRLSSKFINGKVSIKYSDKQHKVIDLLEECETASVKEICYLCNITPQVIRTLINKEALEEYEFEVFRTLDYSEVKKKSPDDIILSDEQKDVYDGLCSMLDEKAPGGALLYGITGSGKTSVFLKLIDYVLKSGRTAMMLVPEISLTPQMVSNFQQMFGSIIAVMHSSLSLGQRLNEYKRVKSGQAKIVIGTRSAVFAPLDNIGLIIMDEEGERTYKSESSPRYHARDVAIQRCGFHKATLLLASATPSIESYYHAKTGRFRLFELNERYNKAELPEVVIVDMQQEAENGNTGIFSESLAHQITENIKNKEQTILLLNRRGYYTYISCLDCRHPLVCPNCNVPLTYHKKNGLLMCHYCGYTRELDKECPDCHSTHLHPTGLGTQKLEDELAMRFPEARVLRMDADTTYSKYAYQKSFTDFADGKYDIMIGTQMIAKGLDFPNVTLVGVLSLDKALFSGDFRSYERTFSLITQVVGRSGRGDKKGYAFIQTYVPEHYVINLAANQDYKSFYEEESALRKVLVYPPYCDICVVGFSSLIEKNAALASKEFVKIMQEEIKEKNIKFPLRVLGPSKCNIEKINNRFRYRIIMKCRNTSDFREFINSVLCKSFKNKLFSNVAVYADINGDIGV